MIKVFLESVSAGFPSPADDYIEDMLDLNAYLIQNEAATFLLRVSGDSMKYAGIFPGDLLIVDRSLNAQSGQVVIASLDGELTVKRFLNTEKGPVLMPENRRYRPIVITEDQDFRIWGVVKTVIHSLEKT